MRLRWINVPSRILTHTLPLEDDAPITFVAVVDVLGAIEADDDLEGLARLLGQSLVEAEAAARARAG